MGMILRAEGEMEVDERLIPTGRVLDPIPLQHDFDLDEPRLIGSSCFDNGFLMDRDCAVVVALRIKNFQVPSLPISSPLPFPSSQNDTDSDLLFSISLTQHLSSFFSFPPHSMLMIKPKAVCRPSIRHR